MKMKGRRKIAGNIAFKRQVTTYFKHFQFFVYVILQQLSVLCLVRPCQSPEFRLEKLPVKKLRNTNTSSGSLTAYVGPIPFLVVPTLFSASAVSSIPSTIWCRSKTTCARFEMKTLPAPSNPFSLNDSNSLKKEGT
jgi:hypothetical protein